MSQPRHARRRTRPLRLLQFTDMHLCPDDTGRVRGVATRQTFGRCLAHARAHHRPVDALLLTGDLVQDDPRAYAVVSALLSPETTPVHCLPGNHDLPQDIPRLLDQRPFDHSPVLRYGKWTLLQLDSSVRGQHQGIRPRHRLEQSPAEVERDDRVLLAGKD